MEMEFTDGVPVVMVGIGNCRVECGLIEDVFERAFACPEA